MLLWRNKQASVCLFIGMGLAGVQAMACQSDTAARSLQTSPTETQLPTLFDPAPTPAASMVPSSLNEPRHNLDVNELERIELPSKSQVRQPDEIKWSYIVPELAVPSHSPPPAADPNSFSKSSPNLSSAYSPNSLSISEQSDQRFASEPTIIDWPAATDSNQVQIQTDSALQRKPLLSRLRPWRSAYRQLNPIELWADYGTGCSGNECLPSHSPIVHEPTIVYQPPVIAPVLQPALPSAELLMPDKTLVDIEPTTQRLPKVTHLRPASHLQSPEITDSKTANASNALQPIIVHPPLIQPYRQNQYTFVVENQSEAEVTNVRVQLSVANAARIFAALPSEALVTDQAALFRIDSIPAGAHVELHVGAASNDDAPISFQSSVSVTSTTEFSIANSQPATMQNVGYAIHPSFTSPKSSVLPAAANSQFELPGGGQFMRNPYFVEPVLTTNQTTVIRSSPTDRTLPMFNFRDDTIPATSAQASREPNDSHSEIRSR